MSDNGLDGLIVKETEGISYEDRSRTLGAIGIGLGILGTLLLFLLPATFILGIVGAVFAKKAKDTGQNVKTGLALAWFNMTFPIIWGIVFATMVFPALMKTLS